MSNYRDDETSTATVSEVYAVGLGDIIQEAAVAVVTLIVSASVFFSDGAIASDGLQSKTLITWSDSVVVSDDIAAVGRLQQYVFESARARDSLPLGGRGYTLSDAAMASDTMFFAGGVPLSDIAVASDSLFTWAKHEVRLADNAMAVDGFSTIMRDEFTSPATASDSTLLAARVLSLVADLAIASDSTTLSQKGAERVTDGASAADLVQHGLSAHGQIIDAAFAEDSMSDGGGGTAWTANMANYATSRYAPYSFTGVAVIRGVPYGTTPHGVFRLDGVGSDEVVYAKWETAKTELSASALVIPREVRLAYESSGDIAVTVEELQKGLPVSYTYPLPVVPADTTTVGRAVLGRGLRGRFYKFIVSSSGLFFNISSLIVSSETAARRIR